MKEMSWSALKQETLVNLKEGPCLKVTGDGLPVFYIIVAPQGGMIARVEGTCAQIDASKGF